MIQKDQILNKILDYKVVAIIRTNEPANLLPIVEAIVAGGINAVEVSLNTPNALEEIKKLADHYKNSPDVLIGAGTVTGISNTRNVIEAGAQFIISPVLEENVIEECNRAGVVAIPGVFSPTEIYHAAQAGAEILKVFPASVLGFDFIKAVKGPLPDVKLMAVGGVNQENTNDFFNAGCDAVGIGSSLMSNTDIRNKDYQKITADVRAYIQSI